MSTLPQENIRDRIVSRRLERIAREGYGFGHAVPATRTAPLIPFVRHPLGICEIKRRSPSRGALAENLDPVSQAALYHSHGVQSISILTEEDHFGGSLADLMAVKQALPQLALLRKDFLVDEIDIEWSYRAGADAVLLIASMLAPEKLAAMHRKAESLGMQALVEVHSGQEIESIRHLEPKLVGINCRNLQTFVLDRLLPLALRDQIDWTADVVFESGIFTAEDAAFAAVHGFTGILVGESVVKKPEIIPGLLQALQSNHAFPVPGRRNGPGNNTLFWNFIAGRIAVKSPRPLVKICGLTRYNDAVKAYEAGADLLGFVFADSPRRADSDVVRQCAAIPCPKIAVVVARKDSSSQATVPPEVLELLHDGLIDAVQFSGNELATECHTLGWPYFKALRPKQASELDTMSDYRSPRILVDAWSEEHFGGSGKTLSAPVVEAASKQGSLWMAGGISPANINSLIKHYHPELVDLSSSLEQSPGIKDHKKIDAFFKEIDHAFTNS